MNDKIRVAGKDDEYCDRRCQFYLKDGDCDHPKYGGLLKQVWPTGDKQIRSMRRKACIDATRIAITRVEYDRLKADAEALAELKSLVMHNAKEVLIAALTRMGADGLWCDSSLPGEEYCGCGLDDFMPCDDCDVGLCYPAKLGNSGQFYPMENERG